MNTMAMGLRFEPQREGRLTRDPNEYIGFPGDGAGTVWGPDYFLDTI